MTIEQFALSKWLKYSQMDCLVLYLDNFATFHTFHAITYGNTTLQGVLIVISQMAIALKGGQRWTVREHFCQQRASHKSFNLFVKCREVAHKCRRCCA